MLHSITLWLEQMAEATPLPLFVIVGGLVEEIIAPIPSPLVSALAGSILNAQNLGIPSLLVICAIGTLAKTLGAWIFYVLGDKLEDLAIPRYGKYIGVKHEDLEHFGGHFVGSWKDDVILLAIRMIPVMPSTPVSLACGILKISRRTFFTSTYIGFYIRNLFFMFLGYTGIEAAKSVLEGMSTVETVVQALIVLSVLVLLAWLYWRRRTHHPLRFLKRLRAEKS